MLFPFLHLLCLILLPRAETGLCMPADILAYWNAHAAAEAQEEPQQWDEWMPAPQHPFYPLGYWSITNLGQKPKLGGVRVSHRHYIHVHLYLICRCSHFFIVPSMLRFIFLAFFLCVWKTLEKQKKLVVVFYFLCMLSSNIKKKTQKDFLVLLLLVGSVPV